VGSVAAIENGTETVDRDAIQEETRMTVHLEETETSSMTGEAEAEVVDVEIGAAMADSGAETRSVREARALRPRRRNRHQI
jgi:hypothetical protein